MPHSIPLAGEIFPSAHYCIIRPLPLHHLLSPILATTYLESENQDSRFVWRLHFPIVVQSRQGLVGCQIVGSILLEGRGCKRVDSQARDTKKVR